MSESGDHPAVRIPPPVLTLLLLIAAYLLGRLVPIPVAAPRELRWIGILLVLIGLGLAVAAVREFVALGTTVDPHSSASALATGGPYRFSRNPIYLGFLCILAGLPLALGNIWGIPLVPVLALALNQLVIRHEEAYLERRFGRKYLDFKSRVRRWL